MDTQPLISEEKKEYGEDYRLGGRSPIVTIFSLLAGPLMSQITNSFYGIVNTLWIERGIGDDGLEVLSSLFLYDMVVFSFGNLLIVSASSHISYLFGRKTPQEGAQLAIDLMRVALLLAIIYPALCISTTVPLVRWLAESDKIAHEALHYTMISSGCSVVPFLYYLMCGILQGEGRTWLFGGMQILALVLDMILFLPLFVVYFKLGVWSAALSQIISQSIPMIILVILLFSGKLTLEIKFSMFFRKFSPETIKALKVGFASFILNLSEAFPQFAQQKFIVLVADHVNLREPVLTSWNIFGRLYSVALCILVAFDSAFIPSASYAYARRQYKRVIRLTLHTLWITIVWAGIAALVTSVWPVEITRLFSKDPQVLELSRDCIWLGFVSLPLYTVHAIVISYLQAVKRPTRATILSIITTLVPLPIASCVCYFTHPNSLRWIFAAYIINDILTTIVTLVGMASPLFRMMRLNDGESFTDEENNFKNSGMTSATSVESMKNMDQA